MANILADHWDTRAAKPGKRMRRCADDFMASVNLKTGQVKQCPMHCDVMLCPTCLTHRHRSTLKKAYYCVGESLRDGDMLRHIVLTAPRWRGDVREGAERLAWWFACLTRRKAWRENVRGHMAVFEATGNAEEGWHWHVHVLTVGQWWLNQCKVDDKDASGLPIERPADPATECFCKHRVKCCGEHYDDCRCDERGRRNSAAHRCLMQEWYQVTGGEARIVHISAAGSHHRDGDAGSPVAEAVKYVVKTQSLSAAGIVDFVIGMRSFQRVRWGGEWFGMQPPDEGEGIPTVSVCPTDLWRLSTGAIGSLVARLSSGGPKVEEAAIAAGWTLYPFCGPMPQTKARPPPSVVLDKGFAVTAVSSLEERTIDLESRTVSHFRDDPDAEFPFITVPF